MKLLSSTKMLIFRNKQDTYREFFKNKFWSLSKILLAVRIAVHGINKTKSGGKTTSALESFLICSKNKLLSQKYKKTLAMKVVLSEPNEILLIQRNVRFPIVNKICLVENYLVILCAETHFVLHYKVAICFNLL